MASSASLPSPRQLLTSIINSLPAFSDTDTFPHPNPLKGLQSNTRSLLTTLHVLFPSPILLPALDLLDRKLVTRIIQDSSSSEIEEAATGSNILLPHAQARPAAEQPPDQRWRRKNYFYVVKSASDSRLKGSGGYASRYGGPQGQCYIVRTDSWHCTCAAFTFSAFPAGGFSFSSLYNTQDQEVEPPLHFDGENGDDILWEFGGTSRNGKEGGAVPCCKHLLACVLAERWVGVLGRYVLDREIGREEMAGIATEP